MRGIVLAGGKGTRLAPLTKVTPKELLLVYNRPMIFYPLQTLLDAGIKDILIVVSPEYADDFKKLLSSGQEFDANFVYKIQEKPEGLAQAFIIGEDFIGQDSVTMILGDNIFEDKFSAIVDNFKSGGHIFAKKVSDPERFGVVKFGDNGQAIKIVEKPKEFLSDYAVTGLYIFDNRVSGIAKSLRPSARNELEITDIHNWYLERGELKADVVNGEWIDAGTFDSLLKASNWAFQQAQDKLKTN